MGREKFLEVIFHSYKKYLFCFFYGVVIMAINNLILSNWKSLVAYSDGAFIAGLSLFCFGGLSIVTRLGAFDIFSYMFAKRDERGFKKPFYDYCEGKKEGRGKKKYASVPYFIVGFLYLIVAFIFVLLLEFS